MVADKGREQGLCIQGLKSCCLSCFVCEFFLEIVSFNRQHCCLTFLYIADIAQDNTMDVDSKTEHFSESIIEVCSLND